MVIDGGIKDKKRDYTSESLNTHASVNKSPVTFLMNSGRGHHKKLAGRQELQLTKVVIPEFEMYSLSLHVSLSKPS